MAWEDFKFTPEDGLSNTTTFPSKPSSGAAARTQFMTILNQIKAFFNGTVKNAIDEHKADNTAHGMPTTASPLPINKGGTGSVTTDGAFTSLCPFIDDIDKTTAGIFLNRWNGSGLGTPPVAGVFGWVLTFNTSASYGSQLFIANDALSDTYRRNLRGGVFQPWVKILTTSHEADNTRHRRIILSDQDADSEQMQNGDIWIKYTDEE